MNLANSFPAQSKTPEPSRRSFSWSAIETIFLDMDGTLLDKHYDDYFWEEYVPEMFAKKKNLKLSEARQHLLATYRSVENTLQWTDLDYWSTRLDLDIAQLKRDVSHLIGILPDVTDFLAYLRQLGMRICLVTNAHPKALQVKMEKVRLEHSFHRLICSQEVGAAKEQPVFWQKLQGILPYDKESTLFADDTEKVLQSAATYGIRHLVHIARSSSQREPQHSLHFPSILSFRELMVAKSQMHGRENPY